MSSVISVFTYKSVETILADGGTQSWKLNRNRAAQCDYVVVCRNAYKYPPEGPEPHGSAFLIGKVKDVVPSTETEDRWLIQISEYAVVDVLNQWDNRNPVAYYDSSEYPDINFKALKYKRLEQSPLGLTIPEAKAALSVGLSVPESAIEIIVRS